MCLQKAGIQLHDGMLYAKRGGQCFQAQAPCAEDFDNDQEAHEFGLSSQHVGKYAWAHAGGLESNLVRGLLSELPKQSPATGKLIDGKFRISHLADPHEMIFIHPYNNVTRLRALYKAIYYSGAGCSQVPGLQATRRISPRRQDGTAHPPTPFSSPPPPLLHHHHYHHHLGSAMPVARFGTRRKHKSEFNSGRSGVGKHIGSK